MRIADEDRTGRARLRDAAIECFAAEGFGASVRTIAERAGVSAGLIRHHFGSKDALREECDQTVLTRYHDLKAAGIERSSPALFASYFMDETGVLMVYILRSVQEGGAAGRSFLEQLIADATATARDAVARGIIRPSRDPEARVRYLVYQAIGGLIVQLAMRPDLELSDFAGVLREVTTETALPTLEVFTHGVFTTTDYLDDYLAYLASPSEQPDPERDDADQADASARNGA